MKLLPTVAFLLLSSTATQASQVEVIPVQVSFQNPKITVLTGGTLQQGANLEVFDSELQRRFSLKTDSQGIVRLPDLPAGQYYLTASTSPTLIGNICLQISGAHTAQSVAFLMELSPHPPHAGRARESAHRQTRHRTGYGNRSRCWSESKSLNWS